MWTLLPGFTGSRLQNSPSRPANSAPCLARQLAGPQLCAADWQCQGRISGIYGIASFPFLYVQRLAKRREDADQEFTTIHPISQQGSDQLRKLLLYFITRFHGSKRDLHLFFEAHRVKLGLHCQAQV